MKLGIIAMLNVCTCYRNGRIPQNSDLMYTCMYIKLTVVQNFQHYIKIQGQSSVLRVHDMLIRPLPVTPAQLMTPGIGRNASFALGDFHC